MPGAVTLDSPAVSQFPSAGGFELIETVSGAPFGGGSWEPVARCYVEFSALLNRLSQSRR